MVSPKTWQLQSSRNYRLMFGTECSICSCTDCLPGAICLQNMLSSSCSTWGSLGGWEQCHRSNQTFSLQIDLAWLFTALLWRKGSLPVSRWWQIQLVVSRLTRDTAFRLSVKHPFIISMQETHKPLNLIYFTHKYKTTNLTSLNPYSFIAPALLIPALFYSHSFLILAITSSCDASTSFTAVDMSIIVYTIPLFKNTCTKFLLFLNRVKSRQQEPTCTHIQAFSMKLFATVFSFLSVSCPWIHFAVPFAFLLFIFYGFFSSLTCNCVNPKLGV